ncbi:hypothetical protein ABZZ79_38890 [Streptomyces sp. NPDC006458]
MAGIEQSSTDDVSQQGVLSGGSDSLAEAVQALRARDWDVPR